MLYVTNRNGGFSFSRVGGPFAFRTRVSFGRRYLRRRIGRPRHPDGGAVW